MYDCLPFERSIQVIYFEGNMRDGPDQLVNRTVRFEPHPLDPVRTGTETHHEEAKLLEMGFASTNDGGWNTDMVVTPTELRRDRRGFMIQPAGQPKTNRRGVGYWIGCAFDRGRRCF
jgi:hypothetical protein